MSITYSNLKGLVLKANRVVDMQSAISPNQLLFGRVAVQASCWTMIDCLLVVQLSRHPIYIFILNMSSSRNLLPCSTSLADAISSLLLTD